MHACCQMVKNIRYYMLLDRTWYQNEAILVQIPGKKWIESWQRTEQKLIFLMNAQLVRKIYTFTLVFPARIGAYMPFVS